MIKSSDALERYTTIAEKAQIETTTRAYFVIFGSRCIENTRPDGGSCMDGHQALEFASSMPLFASQTACSCFYDSCLAAKDV